MNHVTLVAGAVLVVVLTLVLAREMRLRRALQSLLQKLLSFWRKPNAEKPVAQRGDDDADGSAPRCGALHELLNPAGFCVK